MSERGPDFEDLPSNVIALRGVIVLIAVNFRLGTLIFAGAVVLALVLRIVLPTRQAGLLVVRTRVVDITVLSVLAAGLVLLALIVPSPN
jgi:hypothetical protein